MKNFIKYIGLSVIALLLGACNLDQYPYSETAADEYVKDAAAVNNLVIGTYNGLHGVMYYEWAVTELRSDNARMRINNSTSQDTKLIEQLDQATITTAHEWVKVYWNNCYITIDRANKVLANLGVVNDPTTRAQYEGEAKFLRAHIYFNLVRLWGPVFLVTKKLSPGEARYKQRSPVEDVYEVIENDLRQIIDEQMLPDKASGDYLGRVDMAAAKALLAKVYMTRYDVGTEKYMLAGNLLRETLALKGNPQAAANLVAYDQIFSPSNEMNDEIIFAVRYLSGNVGLGCPFGTLFGPLNNANSVIMGSPKHYNYPSDDLVAAFTNNGTEAKPDLRKAVTLKESYVNATTGATINARWCDKFLSPVTTEYDGENDWPVLRVGDAALLLAEWINETAGANSEAFRYLNMIRERAGVEAYATTDLPSKYAFRVAVRNERRLELACENQRWFDLLRWETATLVINEYFESELFYSAYTYKVNPIEQWQTMLPIPVDVIDGNSDVAQNPGY
ncbi:RagB/SusD family nutrient uptake outer membrane protein [uncultured Alistipes sp.]|jgi:ragB/susD domain protein|uniref:RagB/SusD family nutrient uptake outer membrane protein n=1 Tax=uncultured Alistipes sp. TaxID=538949 RepID=UPI0025EEEC21|nr:RagB/SusD family nutrient uptake outer membrane protein [uncultured Alistipes sp.]